MRKTSLQNWNLLESTSKCQHPDHSRQSKGILWTFPYKLLVTKSVTMQTFIFLRNWIWHVFENAEDLETNLTEGSEKTGDNDATRLSMDNMKSLFVSEMVYSSHKHTTISNNQVCLAETSINEACEKYPLFRLFQEPG